MTRQATSAWVLVLVLTAAAGLVWWWLLPPWTAPDEPGHYLFARLLAAPAGAAASLESRSGVEAGILTSLAAHDWWGYNGRSQPANLSSRFAGDPVLAASGDQAVGEPRLFYELPAWWLRHMAATTPSDMAEQLRRLRLGALVLHLLATLTTLVLSRLVWPGRPDRALGLGMLVGLLPMVGFVGVSFNNDALALFWGALAFTLLLAAWLHKGAGVWLAALAVVASGPLVVDPGLLYLWPLTLVLLAVRLLTIRPRTWPVFVVLLVSLCALLMPSARWAAGWRPSPSVGPTRVRERLALAPIAGKSAQIVQMIGGKETLALRGLPLRLKAATSGDPSSYVDVTLSDDVHALRLRCRSGLPCSGAFAPDAAATFLRVAAETNEGEIGLALRLLDSSDRNILFNGDGRQPELLGRPLFLFLERLLPVPAGFFSRAVSAAAWDTAAQLRYALFVVFTWASFWGYYGWLTRPLPGPIYLLLAAATLAAAWGLLRRLPTAGLRWRRGDLSNEDQVLVLSLLALLFILMQTWLPMIGQAWQPQGRYLFSALLPIAILLLLGWEAVFPAMWQRYFLPVLAVALLALNLASWWVILP